MSLAAQVQALATRVATEIKALKADVATRYGPTNPPPAAGGSEPTIAAGTTLQYWRGDKTWQPLNLAALPDAWVKRSVRVASTANVVIATGGLQTVDGIVLAAGDRVLLKNQTTAAENGIYQVNAGAWTRATDANTSAMMAGADVAVDSGTQGGFLYSNLFKATDTLGTTAMSWYRVVDQSMVGAAGGVEAFVATGTTAQYRRGDKTWQTLDKTAVNLANVDNTSDLSKPISTAVSTALSGKANSTHSHSAATDLTGTIAEAVLPSRLRGQAQGGGATGSEPTDWNTAVTSGFYTANNAANAPGTGWWLGEVVAHNSTYVMQTLSSFTSVSFQTGSDTVTYRRVNIAGAWGSWYKVLSSQAELDARYGPLASYPVGSIYLSVSATNPGSIFGGTWVAWGTGRVPIAVDTSNPAMLGPEYQGGNANGTVALNIYNLPPHNHDMSHTHTLSGRPAGPGSQVQVHTQASGTAATVEATTSGASSTTTGNGPGTTNPVNIMPPFITCYMWKRTA